MPIQFSAGPAALLILGLGLVAAYAFFWWFHRQTITDMSPPRKRLALVLRLAIVTLLFLALAGLSWVKKNDALAVIFVMDASRSIRDNQRQAEINFVNEAVKNRRPADTVGLVTFGLDPDVQVAGDRQLALNSLHHTGPTNATDIAQAMNAALPLVPRGMAGKVVVLSDGNENVDSALAEVPVATGQGVHVDSVLLPSSLKKEALIEKLVLPPRVKIGEPFTVRVITNALDAQPARLSLRRNGQPVGGAHDVELAAGRRVHTFETSIDRPGFYRFEATLETDPRSDTILDNNKGLGFVSVRGKPQVLYVAKTPGMIGFLRSALKEQSIDVQYAPPSAMPTTAAALQQFDSVILSDVPRDDFSDAQLVALQVSTRDFGMGLGMIGGEQSFGAGRYHNTPVEEALPVSLEIKKQKRLPSVAVALVIEDLEIPASVNMSKEAAKALVDMLDPMDEAGVLDCNGWGSFGRGGAQGGGANGTWRVPMRHVTDRAAMKAEIDRLDNMGDPPSYDPYLMEAARALQSSEAKVKHIVFLGDGDAIFEASQGGISSTLRAIRNMGITVSTVASAADQQGIAFMAAIANYGAGHAYVADTPDQLPRILLKDQMTISAPPIIEEPFVPREVPGDDVLQGIGALPELLGYNVATPKPTAGVSLVSHRNDPILATWRYGLGRSMAFLSDDKNKWAVHWLNWPGYGKFWAEMVRWTMRSFAPSDYQTQVTMEGTRGHIVVDAIDREGRFVNRLAFNARVVGPDTDGSTPAPDLPLRQTGPGHYEAWFDAAQIGAYLVSVRRDVKDGPPEMTVTGLVVPYSPEYRDLAANEFLMTQLAQAGGGQALTNPSQVYGGNRPEVYASVDLSYALVLLAMLLFPVDVGVRRLALQREDFARALAWARERVKGRRRIPGPRGATPELARLMGAKERVESKAKPDGVEPNGDEPAAPSPVPADVSHPEPVTSSNARSASAPEPAAPTALRQAPPIEKPAPMPPRPTPVAPAPKPAPPEPVAQEKPEVAQPAPEPADAMSRLMAAKRRAREQRNKDS